MPVGNNPMWREGCIVVKPIDRRGQDAEDGVYFTVPPECCLTAKDMKKMLSVRRS